MFGALASLAVVFLGIMINSKLLIGVGFAALVVGMVLGHTRPKPVSQAAAGPRYRHKLIDAPQDAWEMPEDKTWMTMMAGPAPFVIGGHSDFFGNIAMGGFTNPHAEGAVRQVLPFPDYGRSGALGAVEGLFLGLPISIGNFIRK